MMMGYRSGAADSFIRFEHPGKVCRLCGEIEAVMWMPTDDFPGGFTKCREIFNPPGADS
jgi:hypothetical protein